MEQIYFKNGNLYRKLDRNEIIQEGAMQSWCHGELMPIINANGTTVGDKPSSFSDERDFYNPIKESITAEEFEKYLNTFRLNNGWEIHLLFTGIWIIQVFDKETDELLYHTGSTGMYGILAALSMWEEKQRKEE